MLNIQVLEEGVQILKDGKPFVFSWFDLMQMNAAVRKKYPDGVMSTQYAEIEVDSENVKEDENVIPEVQSISLKQYLQQKAAKESNENNQS